MRTGTRSPMPDTSHHAWSLTLAGVAGPLSSKTKTCSSSINDPTSRPATGKLRTIAGPPVENVNAVLPPTAAPLRDLTPAFRRKLQRVPGPRSVVKS